MLRNNECGHSENAIIHGRITKNFSEKNMMMIHILSQGILEGNKSQAVTHIIWNEKVN